ncbi:MAG: EAL domain-containing protein [Nitrospiria bacterium]
MRPTKIFLVEGHTQRAERIQSCLARRGFDVVVSADPGERAMRRATSVAPDLILANTFLGNNRGGIETAREIRAVLDLPIIYFNSGTPGEPSPSFPLMDGESCFPHAMTGKALQEAIEKALLKQVLVKKSSEGEARFRKIFECSQDAIFIICPQANQIREVNPKACEMFGYSREELLAKGIREIYPDQDAVMEAFVHAVYRDGAGWTDQLTGRKRDGSSLFLEIYASLIYLKGSTCILAMKRDITRRKQDETALKESEAKYRTLVETANAAIFIFQGERVLYVNRVAELISGYSRDELLAMPFWGILHPDFQELGKARGFARQQGEAVPSGYEVNVIRKNGEHRWVDFNASVIEYQGRPAVIGVAHDITERKQAEEQLKLTQFTLDRAATPVFMMEFDARFFYVNDAACRSLGYSREELLSMTVHDINPDYPREVWPASWERLKREGTFTVEARHKTKAGNVFPVEVNANFLSFDGREFNCAFAQDITRRKAVERKLRHQAYHDPLTGLANRKLLFEHLTQAISQCRRSGKAAALLFVDLDRFKQVNDTFGHPIGDTILKETAARLRASVRESDTVARVSGDEFLILLPEIADRRDILTVAKKVIESLSVFHLDKQDRLLGASIGIAVAPDDGDTVTDLLKHADMAMYQAKAGGRSRYHFFNERLEQEVQAKNLLEWDLKRAVTQGELALHYQPIVDLTTQQTTCVEVMVRWHHPQKGLVYPDSFIPLAEESDLICKIGEWVLRAACRQARAWRDQHAFVLPFAVNFSSRQFASGRLVEKVEATLAEFELPSAALIIEITESLLLEPDVDAAGQLAALRALGVQIAVDDFGTGYSSLSYLAEYPVDHLKIDRSFIRGIPGDQKKKSLVEAIIRMGESLNLTTIAEGIETEEALACLKTLGCNAAQGYYFKAPAPMESLVFSADATPQG